MVTSCDILEFSALVRRFCHWAENLSVGNDDEVLAAHRMLADLQLNVLSLRIPDVDETVEPDRLTQADWSAVRDNLNRLPVDSYWKIFDVFTEESPVFCTISDDLADIYGDLKEGLRIFDLGHISEAVWQWRFLYFIHWGRNLTGAQTALHQYLFESDSLIQTLQR
jgi:hypothetical protein